MIFQFRPAFLEASWTICLVCRINEEHYIKEVTGRAYLMWEKLFKLATGFRRYFRDESLKKEGSGQKETTESGGVNITINEGGRCCFHMKRQHMVQVSDLRLFFYISPCLL